MYDIGISTACFYPMYLEKALERITKFNVPICEIFFNCFSELEKPFVKELKAIVDSGGMKVSSIHPFLSGLETFLFFSQYDRRTSDGISIYKRMFEAAKTLGAEYFVLHGALNTSTFCGMECYAERYRMISDAAKEFGITLTHENVCRTVTCSAEFVKEFKEFTSDDVFFTFDLKQCLRANEDPFKMIDAMGKNIKNVHINDFDFAKKECRLPCDGDCDIQKIIEKLKSVGYNGNFIIEVYSENYNCDDDIASSFEKLGAIVQSVL